MKLHAYLLCYNEEPIIPFVLDYYSKLCTRVFLLDNYSTDRSVEIAGQYPNVTVIQWDSSGQLDDQKHIELKSSYYKVLSRYGSQECEEPADWVITADMDEIIYHPCLHQILVREAEIGSTVADIIGFDMVSDHLPNPGDALITSIRHGVRSAMMDKPILFSANIDMEFSAGCHSLGDNYNRMKEKHCYRLTSEKIALLHFKHIGNRSAKVAQRSSKRLSENNLKQGWGLHYLEDTERQDEITRRLRQRSIEIITPKGDFAISLNRLKTRHLITQSQVDALAYAPDDAEFFRNLAIIFENIDLRVATRLMTSASRLRPNGPLIQRKIKEYLENEKYTPDNDEIDTRQSTEYTLNKATIHNRNIT